MFCILSQAGTKSILKPSVSSLKWYCRCSLSYNKCHTESRGDGIIPEDPVSQVSADVCNTWVLLVGDRSLWSYAVNKVMVTSLWQKSCLQCFPGGGCCIVGQDVSDIPRAGLYQ